MVQSGFKIRRERERGIPEKPTTKNTHTIKNPPTAKGKSIEERQLTSHCNRSLGLAMDK